MSDLIASPPQVDAAALTPVVRTLLQSDHAEITAWTHAPFGHSLDDVYGSAPAIFRYRGTARDAGRDVDWNLILKIVTTPSTPDDPSCPAHGAREPLAYQSRFLDSITGLRAPRCCAVVDQPDGGYWLWLEQIVEDVAREWPADRYVLAARHLGRFNGTLAANAPRYPWLSRSPLRDAVREFAPGAARIRDARDNPFVALAVTPEQADKLLRLLDSIDPWLDALDQLPQTICHWDAHRANLVSRTAADGTIETVALDWAGVGWGAIGTETSKMLSQTVNFFGVSADGLPALDAAIFAGYLAGLEDSGWRGDTTAVRFAHAAASSARLIVRIAFAIELSLNDRSRAGFERATATPFEALARKFKAALPYYLSLVDEAAQLARR